MATTASMLFPLPSLFSQDRATGTPAADKSDVTVESSGWTFLVSAFGGRDRNPSIMSEEFPLRIRKLETPKKRTCVVDVSECATGNRWALSFQKAANPWLHALTARNMANA